MKRKKLGFTARCSFCKQNPTEYKIQGHPYGGMTVCNNCYKALKAEEDKLNKCNTEDSDGESQLYHDYGAY